MTWVDQITTDTVIIKAESGEHRVLKALGFHRRLLSPSVWSVSYSGDLELATILDGLRTADIPMKGGSHGWPPSERFLQLCEQGLLSGEFREITWRGPDQPVTTTRCGPRPS